MMAMSNVMKMGITSANSTSPWPDADEARLGNHRPARRLDVRIALQRFGHTGRRPSPAEPEYRVAMAAERIAV
jgi:hypothetical protein